MLKGIPKKEAVWVQVVCAYINSANSTEKEGAITWADYIADEYEKRFPTSNLLMKTTDDLGEN